MEILVKIATDHRPRLRNTTTYSGGVQYSAGSVDSGTFAREDKVSDFHAPDEPQNSNGTVAL